MVKAKVNQRPQDVKNIGIVQGLRDTAKFIATEPVINPSNPNLMARIAHKLLTYPVRLV